VERADRAETLRKALLKPFISHGLLISLVSEPTKSRGQGFSLPFSALSVLHSQTGPLREIVPLQETVEPACRPQPLADAPVAIPLDLQSHQITTSTVSLVLLSLSHNQEPVTKD